MSDGSHKASVELEAKVSSLDKGLKQATKRIDEVTAALEKSERRADAASTKLDKVKKSGASMGDTLSDVKGKVGAVVAGLAAVAIAADQASARYLKVAGVMDNAAFAIDKARASTRGLVTDFDLQRLANQALQLQVAKTSEKYAELSGAVVKLGRAQGRDAVDSIERMVSALGKGEVQVLDELGVRLTVNQANEEYAKILGKLPAQLTAVEKAEAVRVVGSRELIKRAKELNDETNTTAQSVQQAKVAMINFVDEALVVGASAMEATADAMGHLAASMMTSGIDFADELSLAEINANAVEQALWKADAAIAQAAIDADPFVMAIRKVAAEAEASAAGFREIDAMLKRRDDADKAAAPKREARLKRERSEAKSAHREHMKHLQDQFKQQVINAKQSEDFYERQGWLIRRNRLEEDKQLRLAKGNPDTPSEANFSGMQRDQDPAGTAANKLAIEQQSADDLLEMRLRQLELSQELGVDPITQIEQEQQARLNHNDFMMENAQTELDRMRVTEQRRQINHDANMKRISAEKDAEKKRVENQAKWVKTGISLTNNATDIAVMAANVGIKNEERLAKFKNRARGIQVIGGAVQETFEAAAAAARYDIPSAVLHAGAAAVGYVQGGLLLSGALDQGGGGGSRGGGGVGGGSGSMSGGSGQSRGGGNRSEGMVEQINSDTPPSPNPTTPTTASGATERPSGGVTFMGPVHLYGTPEEDFLLSVKRGTDRLDRDHRRTG